MVNAVLARRLKRYDIDIQSIDLSPEAEIMKRYNPNYSLEQLNQQFLNLPTDVQAKIASCDLQSFHQIPGIEDFQKQVDEFIQTFGHLSDSGVDFSCIPWREKPNLLFKMIQNYQKSETASKKLRFEELGLHGLSGRFTHRLYQRARRFRIYREQISSIYTYGLDLFRQHYLALGGFLVNSGILQEADDIFFLKDDEIRTYIAGDTNGANFAELVATRKQDMQDCEHVVLPEVIYGDTPPPVIECRGDILTGTPTSCGYYTGRTRVILGIDQFDKMRTGDVLVIPFSDVGWTPLFAKAGALIAESGGLLSHSSIIAREYGIPAVVSVPGALSIGDDAMVSIDGYKGEILIQESHKVNEGE